MLHADTATNLAYAMDVPSYSLVSARFTYLASELAARVRSDWGVSLPFVGSSLTVMATGPASDTYDPNYTPPFHGFAFANSGPNPVAGQTNGVCIEPALGLDYTELELVLNVPTNAYAFSLKFNFFSAEYPAYTNSIYNDRFMIRLTSQAFDGNVAFDSLGHAVSANTAYFAVTNGAELVGTGYDDAGAAAIGWQTVLRTVTPGETITLKFLIFDVSDRIDDSAAVIDAFQWINQPVPVLVSIFHAVEISWPSEINQNYQVEWTQELTQNVWSNLGSVVSGSGTTNSVFDSTRDATHKFYRVLTAP
ncbi:MAG: choice-of-anchor L domain-containing protein [bacterium]